MWLFSILIMNAGNLPRWKVQPCPICRTWLLSSKGPYRSAQAQRFAQPSRAVVPERSAQVGRIERRAGRRSAEVSLCPCGLARDGGAPDLRHAGSLITGAVWHFWSRQAVRIVLSRELIPTRADHHALAQSRRPMDMMIQGWSMRRFHAEQQWSTMSA